MPVCARTGGCCGNKWPCPPSPQPLPGPSHLGGIFCKIGFRLGPNYLLSNRLVCDGAGEKGKASHAMGGHPARQPTPCVGQIRGGREGQALGLAAIPVAWGGVEKGEGAVGSAGAGGGERSPGAELAPPRRFRV